MQTLRKVGWGLLATWLRAERPSEQHYWAKPELRALLVNSFSRPTMFYNVRDTEPGNIIKPRV